MLDIVVGKLPAFAIFKPFLADLVAADEEFPNRFGYAAEVLSLVDPDAPVIVSILHFFDDIIALFRETGDEIR